MDYEKKYKEALAKAKAYFENESYTEMADVFPELRESEDEKVRKCLIAMVNATIWDSSNLASKKACLSWLEKQKDLMPPTHVDPCDASWYAYYQRGLNKGYELGLETGKKEQKPVEISDFKTKLAAYLQNNSPKDGQYVISSETILEMAKEELIKRGVVVEREQCCMGIKGDPDPAGVWKPTEEQMKAIDFARRVLFETYPSQHNGCEPYHILGELYEQLKKL